MTTKQNERRDHIDNNNNNNNNEEITTTAQAEEEEVLFPCLFQEALIPTVASILVFALADLRQVVREQQQQQQQVHDDDHGDHNDNDSDNNTTRCLQVLHLPMPLAEVVRIAAANKELLRSKVRSHEYETMEYILSQEFLREASSSHGGGGDLSHCLDDITVHAVGGDDDDNSTSECVHSILVNPKKKTIMLTFRGSITMQDWITNAKLVTGRLANPLYHSANDNDDDDDSASTDLLQRQQPEFVGVHLGFRDYLYDSDLRPPENKKNNKIDMIMHQIQALMDANPKYQLYISGHSLGGALALLFSLQAAVLFATKEDNPPVTCVTIANPRVGDNHFRGAIQLLERQKKLRCLLIQNYLDLVPSMPNRMCRGDFCRPNTFCQPGMQLIFRAQSFTTRYHSRQNNTRREEFQGELKRFLVTISCWIRMAYHHDYRTYLDRLIAQKEELEKLYLNDLYKEKGIHY